MNGKLSRRQWIEIGGAAALAPPLAAAATMPEPRFEGKDTPKLCLAIGDGGGGSSQEAGARRIKQLGVDYVLSGGGPIPWDEARLRDQMDRLKANGLTLGNLMIAGFNN